MNNNFLSTILSHVKAANMDMLEDVQEKLFAGDPATLGVFIAVLVIILTIGV